MIKYEDLYLIVKEKLSEKRFKHSEAVVKRAIEYALVYNVDIEIVKLTAIAHDIAKELSQEEEEAYLQKYNIELDELEKQNHSLIHSKICAATCKYEYNFTVDMVDAIKYHTTGREEMTILEKIIYLADATEETRTYCPVVYANIIKENIDNGMVEVTKWVIKHLLENNKVIHLESIKCYNYYCTKMSQ